MIRHKIHWDNCSYRRTTTNMGLLPLLEGPPYEVNNKPHLSSNEEKNCAVLDSTLTDYEVNRMDKWYYQAILQGMLPPCFSSLFFTLLQTKIWSLFVPTWLIAEGEGEALGQPSNKGFDWGSLSYETSWGRGEEVMGYFTFIVRDLSAP